MGLSSKLLAGLIRYNMSHVCLLSCLPPPQDKAPGMTSQTPAVAPPGWWVKLVTGYFLFFSPNLVWLTIALADYFLFPYDYEAAKNLTDLNWVFKRFENVNTLYSNS